MSDITVIILTKNEEKNMKACIKSAKQIADRIIVVDCGSSDRTVLLSEKAGAEVYFHEWESYARQFNWALDNTGIETEWVYRLDADEQITAALAEEIRKELADAGSAAYNAYSMRWQIFFMGKRLKYGGTHKPYFTRLVRYGKARIEDKMMDEHFVVEGMTKKLKNDFVHHDYKGLDQWLLKHIKYSQREIQDYCSNGDAVRPATRQQKKRSLYYKLPMFVRARLYFWYRYYGQLGFLDGTAGRVFLYLQAYWYRFIIDAKIYEQENS